MTKFPGTEGAFRADGTQINIHRDQGWLTAQFFKLFPDSFLFKGRESTEYIYRRHDDAAENARDRLIGVSEAVNERVRDGTIDRELLIYFWGDAEQFLLTVFKDPEIHDADPRISAKAWADYLFPLYRPCAKDLNVVYYPDDLHDAGMKQLPLALIRDGEGSPFVSVDLHESPRSILIQWGKPELMCDVIASTAYAADAMDVSYGSRDRIAQYLIADPGGEWQELYRHIMEIKTYGDPAIEDGADRTNPLFRALNALATLVRERNVSRFHYIFYLPDMMAFRAVVQPLLDTPDPRITLIMGTPYDHQYPDIAAEWILHGGMSMEQYVPGYGRLNGILRNLPPHHLAFTDAAGEVRTCLVLKP